MIKSRSDRRSARDPLSAVASFYSRGRRLLGLRPGGFSTGARPPAAGGGHGIEGADLASPPRSAGRSMPRQTPSPIRRPCRTSHPPTASPTTSRNPSTLSTQLPSCRLKEITTRPRHRVFSRMRNLSFTTSEKCFPPPRTRTSQRTIKKRGTSSCPAMVCSMLGLREARRARAGRESHTCNSASGWCWHGRGGGARASHVRSPRMCCTLRRHASDRVRRRCCSRGAARYSPSRSRRSRTSSSPRAGRMPPRSRSRRPRA